MHLTVAIATSGRREILSATLQRIALQKRLPDLVVVCPAQPEDLDEVALAGSPFPYEVVRPHQRGLPAQRNAILRSLPTSEIVLFLDDDFIMKPDFLAHCETAFERYPEMVMLTGHVIADGAQNAGISLAEADRLIAADQEPPAPSCEPVHNCYGCNMALRAAVARRHGVEFDENLPLYGWLEDVDFSRRMAPHGQILKLSLCRGVHMGSKGGRTSGVRLGYSQIVNPLYLWRKNTLALHRATAQMGRNILANLGKAAFPEPWIDRKGRLAGNLLALRDLLTGRADPRKISSL